MQSKRSILWSAAAIIWMIWILYVLLMPLDDMIEEDISFFEGQDKVIHAFLFGVWAWLLTMANRALSSKNRYGVIVVMIFFWAAFTEILQQFSTYRTCEVADFLADIAGGLLVLVAINFWTKKH